MNRKISIILLLIVSLGTVYACQKEMLFNPYAFNDDCNQYTFPFYKIKDNQLFQNDIFYQYSLRYNTKAVIFLYSYLSAFFDPLLISKALPFILCFFSALYIFLLGERIKNIHVGFLAAIIFIMHSWTFSCFSGGHAKSFTFLLLLSFIYYLLNKKYIPLIFILLLQIFIYPPIAVISIISLTLLSSLKIKQFKEKGKVSGEIKFFILLSLGGFFILFFSYLIAENFKGSLFSLQEILNMPEYYSRGRDPHFIDSLTMLKEDHVAENIIGLPPYSPPTWALLSLASLGFILMKRKKITMDPIVTIFCVSGLILFAIAWPLFFHLFSPGRYLKFSPLIYLIILSALALNKLLLKGKYATLKLLFLSSLIICGYTPYINGDFEYYNNVGLYHFLSTLPKESLIAGHPEEVDEIPLIAKRKVFIQFEQSLPYYKTYYKKISQRTTDFFKLYYSRDLQQATLICDFHQIDYVVIKKDHFSPPYIAENVFYTEPFNTEIKQLIHKNKKKDFIFSDVEKKHKIYEDSQFFILEANSIKLLN